MSTANESQPPRLSISIARLFKAPEWGLVAGILFVLLVIYFLDHDHAFFRESNIRPLLHRVASFGVLAVGAAVVIIAGRDRSFDGGRRRISSVVSAKLLTEWLRTGGSNAPAAFGPVVALAIGLTLLLGLTIGLLHALMINGSADSAVHRHAGDHGRPA